MNNTLAINNQSYNGFSFLSGFIFKLFSLLGICAIVGLVALSVVRINSLTREIYELQNYEKSIANLAQENKNLEIRYAKANSLTSIEEKTKSLELEKITTIRYIKLSEVQVAKNSKVPTP